MRISLVCVTDCWVTYHRDEEVGGVEHQGEPQEAGGREG